MTCVAVQRGAETSHAGDDDDGFDNDPLFLHGAEIYPRDGYSIKIFRQAETDVVKALGFSSWDGYVHTLSREGRRFLKRFEVLLEA